MASDLIKLGGLWTNKDKNGKTYLTGKFSPTVKILIFKNEYRESENHPTHIMYLSQVETQPGDENKQPEPEEDEFFTEGEATPRPMAPRSAAPAPRTPAPAPAPARPAAAPAARPAAQRRPSPPPADDDLEDPFAE